MFPTRLHQIKSNIGAIEGAFETLHDLSKWAFGDYSSGSNAQLLSVQEQEDSYRISYWIPATHKELISCEREGNKLEIRWTVDKANIEKLGFHYPVVNHGNWKLTLKVPEDVSDDPGLSYNENVLVIVFKKGKTVNKKRILIE